MSPREPLVVFDIETVPDTEHHSSDEFPKLPFHKVVAISYLRARTVDGPDGRYFAIDLVKSGGDISSTEEDLIKGFFQFIEKAKPRLITFNGRGFDLPVLKYRALKYGLSAPWFAQGESRWENYGHRYGVEWHCDVMDALADFGAAIRAIGGQSAYFPSIPSPGALPLRRQGDRDLQFVRRNASSLCQTYWSFTDPNIRRL